MVFIGGIFSYQINVHVSSYYYYIILYIPHNLPLALMFDLKISYITESSASALLRCSGATHIERVDQKLYNTILMPALSFSTLPSSSISYCITTITSDQQFISWSLSSPYISTAFLHTLREPSDQNARKLGDL